jgi:pimeloyl-ACP methyl ester carboxylesterase
MADQHASDAELLQLTEQLRIATQDCDAKQCLLRVAQWESEHGRNPRIGDAVITHAAIFRDNLLKGSRTKRKLVLLLHGIRDQAQWMDMVKERLESPLVHVQPLGFDYYDAARFMTGIGVEGVIKRVLASIRHAKADHVGAELIIIAHSFGTYVVARILKEEPDIRCSRAIFCGSVVPRAFRFDMVPHCPKIINDCGCRDIWPVIAEGFSVRYCYGAAGVWGLRASGISDRFHDLGHNDYLTPEFVDKYWKPYVDNEEVVPSRHQAERRVVPLCISYLAFGWRLVFLLCIACGAGLAAGWFCYSRGMTILAYGAWIATGLAAAWLARWFLSGIAGYINPVLPSTSASSDSS